jgi:hypothetical protein
MHQASSQSNPALLAHAPGQSTIDRIGPRPGFHVSENSAVQRPILSSRSDWDERESDVELEREFFCLAAAMGGE